MKKKEKIKIIKNIKSKKELTLLIIRVFTLIILSFLIIIGIIFSTDKFIYSYKSGIAYSGGYQAQIVVFDKRDPNFSYDIPNGNSKKGLKLLKNKLDPLSNQNLYLQTLGNNSIEVIIGKNIFKSYSELSKTIQRLGKIYLTNNNGEDLLITNNNNTKERIPLSDIISGSTTNIDESRKPIITLQIKNQQKWDSIINNLKQPEGSNKIQQQLYIWTDIGQMIDNLRNDIDNLQSIATLFRVDIHSKVSSIDWTNIYNIFDVEYYDIGTSQVKSGNLLDLTLNYPISSFKKLMEDSRFCFTTVPTERLLIDSNNKTDTMNKFIDPLRPYLQKIIEYNSYLTEKYKKYIINWNSIKAGIIKLENLNKIITSTETEARQISNLINGGLSGLEFIITGYRNVEPIISKYMIKISIIILSIIILLIFLVLLIYYRLFGLITILTIFSTIIITLYFSSLLKVEISPSSISALIIIFWLSLEVNLLFFSRYKYERYKKNILFEPAMKIANKQTIIILIDALIVLLLFGLSLFWVGTNNIKSFATILLVGLITSFIMVFIVARLMYSILIKLNWKEKYYLLDISKFSLLMFLFKKKWKKNLNNVNKINFSISKINNNELNIINNNELKKNDLMILKNEKDEKNENKKYKKLKFYNITKLTYIIGLILLIIASIVILLGKTNIDNSIKPGINVTIKEELWGIENYKKISNKVAISKLKIYLENFRKTIYRNFIFNIYIIKKQEIGTNDKILVVSTNVTKNTFEYKLLSTIATFYNTSIFDSSLELQKTEPVMEIYILKITIISIIIYLFCIFIYTLFRLNWAYFFGIILSSIFMLIVMLSITIIMQLLITFEMLIAFLTIFGFSITFGIIIMVCIKQNKKEINNDEYKRFFIYITEYKNKIKYLHNYHKIYYKDKLKKLILKYSSLKLKEIKKKYYNELLILKKEKKEIKNKNRKIIKEILKKFYIYNYKYNFLKKIANITIKQMLQNYLIIIIIFSILLITLSFFSGVLFSFNIVILIGIIVGIFTTIFIAIPIWISLEKYRILNKIHIKNYLDSKYIEIDEQIVNNIND